MSTRPNNIETSRIGFENSKLRAECLYFDHSIVEFEVGPVGAIARIVRDDGSRGYAGPLPRATIDALREVGRDV